MLDTQTGPNLSALIGQIKFEVGKDYSFSFACSGQTSRENRKYIGCLEVQNKLHYPTIETLRWFVFKQDGLINSLVACKASHYDWNGRIDINLYSVASGSSIEELIKQIEQRITVKFEPE